MNDVGVALIVVFLIVVMMSSCAAASSLQSIMLNQRSLVAAVESIRDEGIVVRQVCQTPPSKILTRILEGRNEGNY